jgi:deoxycytidylate deaminase
MRRVEGQQLETIRPHFDAAALIATRALCRRAKCGAVIVKDGAIVGEGYNGPPLDDESQLMCTSSPDLEKKPKYDKTCCVHAEWRAVIDACRHNSDKLGGSVLVFMRIDEDGNFTDAGDPYCTPCSRLTMEAGIGEFALWNKGGADIYTSSEYNEASYAYYAQ